jgi:hypothetical protein
MRNLVAILCVALGLTASGAGVGATTNSASVQHAGMHKACYWVSSERTLRPLLTTHAKPVIGIKPKAIAATSSPVATPRPGRAHIRVAPEPSLHFVSQPTSPRVALMVGVAY